MNGSLKTEFSFLGELTL